MRNACLSENEECVRSHEIQMKLPACTVHCTKCDLHENIFRERKLSIWLVSESAVETKMETKILKLTSFVSIGD